MDRESSSSNQASEASNTDSRTNLRQEAIAALREVIYAQDSLLHVGTGTVDLEHDPMVRHRTNAVELLGRFPDAEAVTVLAGLLLRGERDLPAPIGRWLRDTALLALL